MKAFLLLICITLLVNFSNGQQFSNITQWVDIDTEYLGAKDVQVFDLNSDNLLDIISLSRDGKLQVFYGDGTGDFNELTILEEGVESFKVGDIDGDGDNDVIDRFGIVTSNRRWLTCTRDQPYQFNEG